VSTGFATFLRSACLVAVAGLAACASGGTSAGSATPPTASDTQTSVSVGAPAEVWVAVLDTAGDPSRLSDHRKEVLRELGNVLEGSVVISPGDCVQGLPAEMTEGYILAIQRSSREDLQALESTLSETPSFTGDVTIMCSD
jgi:hypothetical protein